MNNATLFVHVPRTLKTRVRVAAARGETTLADFVRSALEAALQAVEAVSRETP
jgi:glycosyltransferase A (GT-A) superfamily protein (DUF2064 family)